MTHAYPTIEPNIKKQFIILKKLTLLCPLPLTRYVLTHCSHSRAFERERVVGCFLVERRYLRSKNVTMMDFSTTCIEVLCGKCHVVFFLGDYDVLKDCYMKDSMKFVHA